MEPSVLENGGYLGWDSWGMGLDGMSVYVDGDSAEMLAFWLAGRFMGAYHTVKSIHVNE